MYLGLTKLDRELKVVPGLAQSWSSSPDGKIWRFTLRKGIRDHRGDAITADNFAECLENYRSGTPISPLIASIPSWRATRHQGNTVIVELSDPDPYLVRNLTSFRYFRTESTSPCSDPPEGARIWGSGPFRAREGFLKNLPADEAFPDQEFVVVPNQGGDGDSEALSSMSFRFVRDENTRLLWLLRGDADAVLNGFSLSKTGWIRDAHSKRFTVIEREGATVDYLAFNLKDPVLSDIRVRKAIALAIDRDPIIKHKHAGYTQAAGSFLPPTLAESHGSPLGFDLAESARLLDDAGYRPGTSGVRLTLAYKTTSAEIGIERALLLKDMLRKAGIVLELQVVEPAVFFASLKKGAFQLYSSRWVGASDGSIYWISLATGQSRNRVGYTDAEMDRLLASAMSEMNEQKRIALLARIQEKMRDDLPYLPLWFWKNTLVLDRRLTGMSSTELAINGSYETLARITRPNATEHRSTK